MNKDITILKQIEAALKYTVFNINIFKLVSALVIILLFLTLRQLFVKVVVRMLKKLTARTKTVLDDLIVDALEIPVRFLFVVLGIWIASKVLSLPEDAQEFIYRMIHSLIAFSLFWAAYRSADVINSFLKEITDKTDTKLDDMLVPFLHSGLKVIVIISGTVTILQQWVENIGGLLAGLGLGGLAFALAAKDTAANLFGSITVMVDRPFGIGDWIMTPHVEGTVEGMGFRSTRIRTFAQALVTIPNSVMSNDPITNWSRMGKRRVSFRLGLSYGTTSEQIKECVRCLRELLENHSEVHAQTIYVYFEKFGESSLDILLYFFTKTTVWQKYLEVQEDINFKIMEILEELEITVAFPSRSVYVESRDSLFTNKPKKCSENQF